MVFLLQQPLKQTKMHTNIIYCPKFANKFSLFYYSISLNNKFDMSAKTMPLFMNFEFKELLCIMEKMLVSLSYSSSTQHSS